MPYTTLDHTRFYYQQTGHGPDVVLIHAVTSNMALWVFSGIIEVLSKEFRVTAYDLRGHGMSDLSPTGYTSKEMADDLKKLHTALGLDSAFLVGHSFGGVIAMHASLLYPEICNGVILSDTYFPGLAHLEPNLKKMPVWQRWCEVLARVGADIGESVDFQLLFRVVSQLRADQMVLLEKELDPFAMRWLLQLAKLSSTSCGKDAFAPAGLTEEYLCTSKHPLLALYDEHTAFAATREFLKKHLPLCTVEDVPAANHLAPLENPTVFIQLVQKHLRQRLCIS